MLMGLNQLNRPIKLSKLILEAQPIPINAGDLGLINHFLSVGLIRPITRFPRNGYPSKATVSNFKSNPTFAKKKEVNK